MMKIDNPVDIENADEIKYWYEPICTASIISPAEYVKGIKELCYSRRGLPEHEEYLNDGKVVSLTYSIPLAELVIDFFDRLKSIS
jgi:GTP-binding protein LepA